MRRVGAFLALLVIAACGRDATPPPVERSGPGSREFVGASACRGCHQEIASTYAHTGMGRAWARMRPELAVEDFSGTRVLEIPRSGLRYRMHERDGRYLMTQFVLDGSGRERAADEREIVWITGSNRHSRSYATVVDGQLFQMPVCWYPEQSRWDLCPGYEHKNDYYGRELEPSCVFCHNGRMVRVEGTRSRYEEPIPEGIGCERCHGPGSLHVAKWERGDLAPTGAADPTIVNPRRLPQPERIQVCFQCHLGDSMATERVGREGKVLEDWRPGEPLTDYMVPVRWREPTAKDFGISAQADRFVLSRCYTSGSGIECLTCHDPHVTVYRKDRPADFFSSKCLGCHDVSAGKRGEDCVSCHMRRGEPDDHPHTTFTDHWIRKRADLLEPNVRTSLELEAFFPEAFRALPASERAWVEGHGYFLKAFDVPQHLQKRVLADAERRFREAIALGRDTADSRFFLGRTLSYLGRRDEAIAEFRIALGKDPSHHDAAFDLGRGLLRAGKLDDAASVLETMAGRHPRSAAALAELAECRVRQGRLDDAAALLDRAIGIEPWTATLHATRAGLFAQAGRMEEAYAAASEATRYAPEDPRMWGTLARVAAALGKTEDAREGEAIARRLAAAPAPSDEAGPRMGGP